MLQKSIPQEFIRQLIISQKIVAIWLEGGGVGRDSVVGDLSSLIRLSNRNVAIMATWQSYRSNCTNQKNSILY